MSQNSSRNSADVEEALSGHEPSVEKVAGAVASAAESNPVDDEGEESDTYDDFEHDEEENHVADDDEEDEDDEDGDGTAPSGAGNEKTSLTALLLANPNAPNGADQDEEEDDDEEDDRDFNEDDEDNDEAYQDAPEPAAGNGKKRSIDELNGEFSEGEEARAKKTKA